MRFIELFAGLGGLGYGLMQAGMECVGFVECDTQCTRCKDYTQHQPHPDREYTTVCQTCGTSKLQQTHMSYQMLHDPRKEMWSAYDVTTVTDDDIRRLGRDRGPIQLIAAGFPCQAFSVAGKREGFADQTRGTLFFEVVRFASVLRPEFLLLENVDGLRNHDGGRTLGIILSTLDEMGYMGGWQVLNSKDHGVPQNRERIFIVASLGDGRARKVFPIIGENNAAIEVVGRLEENGHDQNRRIYGTGGVAPALTTMGGGGQEPKILDDQGRTTKRNKLADIAPTLRAQSHGNEPKVMVVGNVNPSGNGMNGQVFHEDGLAPTLTTNKGEGNKIAVNVSQLTGVTETDQSLCLDANYFKGLGANQARTGVMEPRAVLTPDRMEKRQNGRRMKEPGEPMFTLTAQDKHGVAVLRPVRTEYGKQIRKQYEAGEIEESRHNMTQLEPREDGIANTLTTVQKDNLLYTGYRIRKLTPLECFRLQSWPDEWYVKLKLFRHPEYIDQVDMSRNDITRQVLEIIANNGLKEGISDSQLYKMAGNGVTSAVSYDIGTRLMEVSE